MKLEFNPVADTQALTVVKSDVTANAIAINDIVNGATVALSELAQEGGKFLPYIFVSGDKMTGVTPWQVMIRGNGLDGVVEAPCVLVHLATYPMVRKLDGAKYTDRCYGGKKGRSAEKFVEIMEKLGDEKEKKIDGYLWQRGFVHLVAYFGNDDRNEIVTIEAAKAMESYFATPLSKGDIRSKKGVRLTTADHSKNTTVSKISGNPYLSSHRFKQWEIVELNEAILATINALWDEKQEAIQNFLEK